MNIPKALLNKIAEEPVISASAVGYVVAVGAAFGFDLDPELVLLIMTVLGAILAFIVRQYVTPSAHLPKDELPQHNIMS